MAVSGARPASAEEEAAAASRSKKRASILGALREAVRKVRFLLSSGATRWMLLARAAPRRGLSFGSRPPGLLDVEGSVVSPAASSSSSSSSRTSRSASLGTATTRSLSRASSAAAPSSPEAAESPASSGGDSDVNRRADLFISNFRRHLEMERQVSLQLRYVRLDSWDRATP